MIIQFKPNQEKMIAEVKKHFAGKTQVFVHKNNVGLVGVQPGDLTDTEKGAAKKVIMNHPRAIQGSRLFHPEDTVIKTKNSIISDSTFTLMAGPCSVDDHARTLRLAKATHAAGATVLRGGAFKPRTSPYSFQGMGETGLKYLREAADKNHMDVITEVMDPEHVPMVGKYTDIFQIGARNMQNFSLLRAVGKTRKPVMLKRGMCSTIDDLLNASEYIAAGGNHQIMLCERGIRTFDNKYTRNTLDVGAIPVLKKLTHYPVILDPSHAAGHTDIVMHEAMAGAAIGADGLMIEVHDDPKHALSDGPQALLPSQFKEVAKNAVEIHDIVK
ncbi:3-deoxy-7-phosphoheptulonate synthase [Acetilactobacillus jinshanensis]|uniref:3-deoxy-7-phosphoheptulonate synthase n=1 Tax=Acetilactobacillus jinshanensis TaxID=1720083 RepID=A0A4P6ZLN9_9LACO|nr:3-deoxy-7-phosphoheptulonate synthase [Acetilactobacillus jinshanensis]QBP18312.1 3-deoxy-7-phosphoheptulonate synthase [Acetilactobacillus jinshanensis]